MTGVLRGPLALVAAALLALVGCDVLAPFDRAALPAPDGSIPAGCTPKPTGVTRAAMDGCPSIAPITIDAAAAPLDTEACRYGEGVEADHLCMVETTSGPRCAIVGSAVTIGPGGLRAVGPRPLLVLATGPVIIDGPLDVGAEGQEGGADGGDGGDCAADGQSGGGSPGSGGLSVEQGGGGGGLGDLGGRGGCDGGAGGEDSGGCQAVELRGGAGGGGAGRVAVCMRGGGGGGAVQIFSAASIAVTTGGSISASGADGDPGSSVLGSGGGGGSGGTILLEAPVVQLSGTVEALGGDGGDVRADGSTTPSAAGGPGGDDEGAPSGGAGACSPDVIPYGSGGGGSVGRVHVRTAYPEDFSPTALPNPRVGACLAHELLCE